MTPAKLATLVRFDTNTDSAIFTDEMLKALANEKILEISEEIVNANEDFFISPATANLVADQREYPFPVDMLLKMKYLEIKFDSDGDWQTITELDLNDYNRATDEETIISYFSNEIGKSKYDINRGSLFLYSGTIENVTNGLKLWYASEPAVIEDLTEDEVDMSVAPSNIEHGFPKAFHQILRRAISIEWKNHADVPIPLTEREQNYRFDLDTKLGLIKNPNLSRAVIRSIPDMADPRFGNNGYDF